MKDAAAVVEGEGGGQGKASRGTSSARFTQSLVMPNEQAVKD